ncbi:MAG: CTP synthase [Planctomycetota bacterium]
MSKHIFITGGVVSSLGKGLTSASIGLLLESRGLRIRMQKLDPYINVDPGTMSPFQHGEVYVLDDGSETDLDLGHYERFTSAPLSSDCNFTTGKIYDAVIRKERAGKYLGQTVQVIPHITDEIRGAIDRLTGPDVDVVITEIGGTVGDIESLPFLEAIRQVRLEEGAAQVMFIHLTLLPYLRASQEVKTKPTQQSVGKLREIGIQPDILICRSEKEITDEMRKKISLFCNVESRAVILEKDVDYSIYEVPILLLEQNIDKLIAEKLVLPPAECRLDHWRRILSIIKNPENTVEIGIVGKYIELNDAYKSIYESLAHAGIATHSQVKLRKVNSERIEKEGAAAMLQGLKGILVPGGFGERGVEGKIESVRYARETGVPYLGLCYGLHMAVIEIARHLLHLDDANTTEVDPSTRHPVITLLDSQRNVTDKGGTMRLGAMPCKLFPGVVREAYGADLVHERHRHRYEVNPRYRDQLASVGLKVAGVHPERELVEIMELEGHPFFVGVQFHPEFKSKPTKAHPLFEQFIRAALRYQEEAPPLRATTRR